jgi:multimeric flavodoxin WrbA
MKLVAIIGSPRGMKGNTGRMLGALLDAARLEGAETTTFALAELDVQPCKACEACHKVGACVIKDDYETIKAAMLEADGIIIASPNYIYSVSAQTKAFLDRCSCAIHCQMLEGRYGAAVVTSGGGDCEEVENYILRVLRALGCWAVGSVGTEAWRLGDEAHWSEPFARAATLGRELVAAIRERRTYGEQVEERRSVFERMKDLVTRMKDSWRYEYEYWKARKRL